MHRQTCWDDHCRTTCPTDLKVAVRSLQQVSPANIYQASGPPCRCAAAVMPGVKTASMYCAECFSPALIASGPISATRFPLEGGLRPGSSMVINHILPNDSTTVPCGPLSVSAAARLSYVSKYQYTAVFESWPIGAFDKTQHPTSVVR